MANEWDSSHSAGQLDPDVRQVRGHGVLLSAVLCLHLLQLFLQCQMMAVALCMNTISLNNTHKENTRV